jgi:hypothetical protein
MFNLFKSGSKGIKVADKVWMSTQAKMNACLKMHEANPDIIFICWFDETVDTLRNALPAKAHILKADVVTVSTTQNKMVVFAEHYPLAEKEQHLFSALGLEEAPVLCALDEPFFEKFGGENLIGVMKNLGMKEDEIIGHSMVSKSIRNAQDKIAKHVRMDHPAHSQREWMQRVG